ncbi:Pentatricopeptide repeat-containing protein At4g19191, mitochondrial [Linum perenne]
MEMANIYASAGKWENFAGIRNLMKHNKLNHSSGKSYVEVNGKLFDFTVEDRGRVEGKKIYAVLENLVLLLKEEVHDEQSLGFEELEAA